MSCFHESFLSSKRCGARIGFGLFKIVHNKSPDCFFFIFHFFYGFLNTQLNALSPEMPCFENRRIPPAQVVYLSFTAMCIFIYVYLINAKNRRLQVQCIIILFYWHWHMRWSAKGLWPVLLVLIAVPGTARAAASSDNRHRPVLLPLLLYGKRQRCYPRLWDEILDYYWLYNLLHLLRGHTVCHVFSLSGVSRLRWCVIYGAYIWPYVTPLH